MNKSLVVFLFLQVPFIAGCISTPLRDFSAYDLCYGGYTNSDGGEEIVVCINDNAEGIGRMGLHYENFPIRRKPTSCVQYVEYEFDSDRLTINSRRASCADGLTLFTKNIFCISTLSEKYECNFLGSERRFDLYPLTK